MRKNILKLSISITTILLCLTFSYSFEGFRDISISEIKDINAPLPQKATTIDDDTIGIDASIKIPLKRLKSYYRQTTSHLFLL